jgi:hypothetical protein
MSPASITEIASLGVEPTYSALQKACTARLFVTVTFCARLGGRAEIAPDFR